ncbi:hypothetical protein [Undibacterium parvum]|nr:hypothetical protein [Undibacterium parvum]
MDQASFDRRHGRRFDKYMIARRWHALHIKTNYFQKNKKPGKRAF